MSNSHSRIAYAFEQSPGTVSPEPPQQDRVQVEEIRTRGGLHITLAAVVDGDGHRKADEAAEMVIEQLFSGISRSVDRHLNAVLRDQLQEGAQSLFKANKSGEGIGEVGVTVVAIHRGRLFFAHSGHTMAVLVREGETTQLTRPGERLLGNSEAPKIQTGDPSGIAVQAGDRVVLGSDGLTRISPEDGHPFVGMDKIAAYVEGSAPIDAVRHLISLALGRDVDDNVTVAVIQIRGERVSIRPLVILISLAVILALGALVVSRLRPGRTQPTVDYGYAVLVQGSVSLMNEEGTRIEEGVGFLGTIPAGMRIVSHESSRLALESTYEGLNNLSGMSLYLERDTQIQLTSIDPHGDPSNANEDPKETVTVVNLLSGRFMVVRDEGDRELHITWNGITAMLMGEAAGALGVWDSGESLVMDCLQGQCRPLVVNGVSTILAGGQRAILTAGLEPMVEEIPIASFQEWNVLCGGCLIEQ